MSAAIYNVNLPAVPGYAKGKVSESRSYRSLYGGDDSCGINFRLNKADVQRVISAFRSCLEGQFLTQLREVTMKGGDLAATAAPVAASFLLCASTPGAAPAKAPAAAASYAVLSRLRVVLNIALTRKIDANGLNSRHVVYRQQAERVRPALGDHQT